MEEECIFVFTKNNTTVLLVWGHIHRVKHSKPQLINDIFGFGWQNIVEILLSNHFFYSPSPAHQLVVRAFTLSDLPDKSRGHR